MVVALASLAFGSGVAPEEVPFEEVARRAGTIVIAHPADPPTRKEKKGYGKKDVPDYEYQVGLWTIDRVIVGTGLVAGETVAIIDPAVLITADSHEMYYVNGISEWVVIETYTATGTMPDGPERMLFLGTSAGPTPGGRSAWCLVASGAVESPKREDDAIRARKSPSP